MIENRIFGPPGTGKTTRLKSSVHHAAEKFGKDKVIVASFTRAAAKEIAGRQLDIPEDRVATLHAHCFRALGNPKIAEDSKMLKLWNEEHPTYKIGGGYVNLDDPLDASVGTEGDDLMRQMGVLRAKMIPSEKWPMRVKSFMIKWNIFKNEHSAMDFTDLIENCLIGTDTAPGTPAVGIFDECQDFVPLELALVRKWGAKMEYTVMAADDDQTLYQFKGADPKGFLEPDVPAEHKQVLNQSHRVPRAVYEYSKKMTGKISYREPKEYRPRDEEGEVKCLDSSYARPENAVAIAEKLVSSGETAMFLTSCGYMLTSVMRTLKESGLPYGNKYRETKRQWNPLETKAVGVVLSFCQSDRMWNHAELREIVPLISADCLIQGAKTRIEMEEVDDEDRELSVKELLTYFKEQALSEILGEPSPRWLLEHSIPSRRESIKYAVETYVRSGEHSLTQNPSITVGTIHSVKGGEADNVFLFPDISTKGFAQWVSSREMKDTIYRQFYVGATRARKRLFLCQPATKMFFHIT